MGVQDLQGFRVGKKQDSFLQFLKHEMDADKTVAVGTAKYRQRTYNYLKSVGDITFKNFNYEAVLEFDRWLIEHKKLDVSTRKNHHNQLRKFAQVAVNMGKMKNSPYRLFKIKRPPKTMKKCLWFNDLDRLWGLQDNGKYELVRMKFLFSCYTGLRISDSRNIKKV